MSDNIFKAKGFRKLKVVRKVVESDIITSFYLQPIENMLLPSFKAGQFLTFGFEHSITQEVLVRTYSISSAPGSTEYYRISVKRELSPTSLPNVPPGVISNYLHDYVAVNDSLWVKFPKGHFHLDDSSDRPVVLLSGGVGLTPMVSMAHALSAGTNRDVWFIHACEDGAAHAFDKEIRALVSPKFHYHVCYREPRPSDQMGVHFDTKGFVTLELLQDLLPLNDYDFYLCGPPAFMQAEFSLLTSLGVSENRISYEFFGPATVLKQTENTLGEGKKTYPAQPINKADELEPELSSLADESPLVTFSESGIVVPWDPQYGNLLDFAEAHQLSPSFSCRAGVCSTCECGLLKGDVTYVDEPLTEPEPGKVLICCSVPSSDIILNL